MIWTPQPYKVEHFSEKILTRLEDLFGPLPMRIVLKKCNAPVPGFKGIVGVERTRYFPDS